MCQCAAGCSSTLVLRGGLGGQRALADEMLARCSEKWRCRHVCVDICSEPCSNRCMVAAVSSARARRVVTPCAWLLGASLPRGLGGRVRSPSLSDPRVGIRTPPAFEPVLSQSHLTQRPAALETAPFSCSCRRPSRMEHVFVRVICGRRGQVSPRTLKLTSEIKLKAHLLQNIFSIVPLL